MKAKLFILALSAVSLLSANETFQTKCSTCHGLKGEKEVSGKVGHTRALSSISKAELVELMNGYKDGNIEDGKGHHGLGKIMREQLRPLSSSEIENLASYISNLNPKLAKKE